MQPAVEYEIAAILEPIIIELYAGFKLKCNLAKITLERESGCWTMHNMHMPCMTDINI